VRKLRWFVADSGTRSGLSAQSHAACAAGRSSCGSARVARPWRSVSEDSTARDGSSPVPSHTTVPGRPGRRRPSGAPVRGAAWRSLV
jgi:hypothetical protein